MSIDKSIDETEIKNTGNLAVEIHSDVYDEMMYYIQKASGEVSGLGNVELIDGVFTVTSIVLLDQSNTAGSSEMTANAVGKAMFELKDEPGTLNFWWHSHSDFEVFWSGTDMTTIRELGQHGWFVSTVLNKAEDMRSAYYQKGNDFMPEIFVDHLGTTVLRTYDAELETGWNENFDNKVEERIYTPATPASRVHFPGFGGSIDEFFDDENKDYPTYMDETSRTKFEELTEQLMEDTDFTEEEINQMIVEEIERKEAEDTMTKQKRNKG